MMVSKAESGLGDPVDLDDVAHRVLGKHPGLRDRIDLNNLRAPGALYVDLVRVASLLPRDERRSIIAELTQQRLDCLVVPYPSRGTDARVVILDDAAVEAKRHEMNVIQRWHARSDLLIALTRQGEDAVRHARELMNDRQARPADVRAAVAGALTVAGLVRAESNAVRRDIKVEIEQLLSRQDVCLDASARRTVVDGLLERTRSHLIVDNYQRSIQDLADKYDQYQHDYGLIIDNVHNREAESEINTVSLLRKP